MQCVESAKLFHKSRVFRIQSTFSPYITTVKAYALGVVCFIAGTKMINQPISQITMSTQPSPSLKKTTEVCFKIILAKPLFIVTLLLYVTACGPERRQDLQDTGKVSVSDSTSQGMSGDQGVGEAGKGYAKEGRQDVASGSDSAGLGTNSDSHTPKNDTSAKR